MNDIGIVTEDDGFLLFAAGVFNWMLSASDENVKDDDCSSSAAAAELKCRTIL
jgi:hypothetical protein